MLNKLFVAAILIAASDLIPAQSAEFDYSKISLSEGLSQSTVTAIVQDRRGFMWFGTQDGLNRFDGYTIKVYKHIPSDSNSISDNGIWSLLNDSNGDLWIGTERGGVDRYVYSENKFYHYRKIPDDNASISDNYVLSLFEDSNKTIWIGTQRGGLCRFNRTSQTFTRIYFIPAAPFTSSPGNSVRVIKQDKKGNLWAATGRGLVSIDASEMKSADPHFKNYQHDPSDPESHNLDNVNSIYRDSFGIFWVGTWGAGIYRFNPETGNFLKQPGNSPFPVNAAMLSHSLINSITKYSGARNEEKILIGTYDSGLFYYDSANNTLINYLDDNILFVYQDRSGILWIGTFGNGVKVIDKSKTKFVHHFNDSGNSGLQPNNAVLGILLDEDGELWVSGIGNVLNRYNRRLQKIMSYYPGQEDQDISGGIYISSIAEAPSGKICIGTISGGIFILNKKYGAFEHLMHDGSTTNSPLSNDVATLFVDKAANLLWIGYLKGGVSSYNLTTKIFKHFYPDDNSSRSIPSGLITTIFKGERTGLWIGIADKGVVHFTKSDSLLEFFRMTASASGSGKQSSINNNYVFSFYEDDDGIIWMGTKGGGLNRYDPSTMAFKNFTAENGLPNNVIYGIEPDKSGNLWLSTNMGLSRFNPATAGFRNYDTEDGLQSNEFSEQAYFASPDGELFFGGVNGYNSFYPEEIIDNDYIPPVYFTDFKVFDKSLGFPDPLPVNKPVELSWSQNFFSFEFVALNYTLPEKNQYAYMLEGFDNGWHYVTAAQRRASYTNLDPGTYILHVRASNNDGLWNKAGASLTLIVTPPFWMTLWFQLPLAALFLLILFLLYRYRVKKLLEVEHIRSSIALDLHDEIGSTLTEIALYTDVSLQQLRSELIQNRDDGRFTKVEDMLQSIGKTSRMLIDAMNDIVWAVNPKNDSMESFLLRIKTQTGQMLSAKGIDYKINIQEEVAALRLPLMYRRQIYLIFREALNNIIKHAGAGNVEINISKEGKTLRMIIADDGIGMNIMELKKGSGLDSMKRRASLLNGGFEIKPNSEKGTSIEVNLKLN